MVVTSPELDHGLNRQDVTHMYRGERNNKDVEVSTWERDGGSTHDILWANELNGMEESDMNSSMVDANRSTVEKNISDDAYIDIEEESSSGPGGGTLPVPSCEGETQHEPEETNDHSGTARTTHTISNGGGVVDGGEMVDLRKITRRFREQTRLVLKESSSIKYERTFRRFYKAMDLGRYSTQKLRGKAGKKVILDFLYMIPLMSRKTTMALIKRVWTKGLGIDWPVVRDDIGKLPRVRRDRTPSDDVVRQWREAMKKEPDTYLRLLWLLVAEHGWRPSHVGKIKWANVIWDTEGMPIGIYADGATEGFKTISPIAARLCPEVQEALMGWKKELDEKGHCPRLLVPWRTRGLVLMPDEEMTAGRLRRIWGYLKKKWRLPHLRAKDLRHWVATICRRMSKQATAYLLGHDPTFGEPMAVRYDNPQIEVILDEQAQHFPDGLLATLDPPKVELMEDIDPELLDLIRRFMEGEILPSDLVGKLLDLRHQNSQMVSPHL